MCCDSQQHQRLVFLWQLILQNISEFCLALIIYSWEIQGIFEPLREKTNNLEFRPEPTQIRLYSHRSRIDSWNFGFKKRRNCTICVAKSKALISFAVTAKLICTFDFAYADCWVFHTAAHFIKFSENRNCTVWLLRLSNCFSSLTHPRLKFILLINVKMPAYVNANTRGPLVLRTLTWSLILQY